MSDIVNANAAEIERFAQELKQFNDQLRESTARLNAGFSRLGDTWRDQGHQKFAQEYQQTIRILTQFMRSADAQIPFLRQRAQRLRDVDR